MLDFARFYMIVVWNKVGDFIEH